MNKMYPILLALLFMTFVVSAIVFSSGILSLLVNLIMIFIMAAILVMNYVYDLRPVERVKNELKGAQSNKTNTFKFNCKELKKAYDEYNKSIDSQGNGYADIYDYIDTDIIDRMIDRDKCERLSGVMTGLGILGTFIGLIIGLYQFDISYAEQTVLQKSIMGLMDGIKTAFLTSVYGVVYSIVYNYFYKKYYNDACNELINFCDNHSKGRNAEYMKDVTTRLDNLPKAITENLAKGLNEMFSNQINAQKDEHEELKKILGQSADFSQQISSAFDKTKEYLDNLDSLQKSINKADKDLMKRFECITEKFNELEGRIVTHENSIADGLLKNTVTVQSLATVADGISDSLTKSIELADRQSMNMTEQVSRIEETISTGTENLTGLIRRNNETLEDLIASNKNINGVMLRSETEFQGVQNRIDNILNGIDDASSGLIRLQIPIDMIANKTEMLSELSSRLEIIQTQLKEINIRQEQDEKYIEEITGEQGQLEKILEQIGSIRTEINEIRKFKEMCNTFTVYSEGE